MSDGTSSGKPHAYVICGGHGGYFLTSQGDFSKALRRTECALEEHPDLKYSMEVEAFTLDRFVRGPQLDVEKRYSNWEREDQPEVWLAPEIAERLKTLATQGRIDNVSTYTQPILHALDGEAIVRQFGYARRIQREVLGIELDYYAAQEPCWCGQIPAILNGFNMKGCIYETSWGPFGFAPLRNGESFRWRGPDGSEIRTVTSTPAVRETGHEPDKEKKRHWGPWINPMWKMLKASTINSAEAQGLDAVSAVCLSVDFTSKHPDGAYDRTKFVQDDCEITFTTLGHYLEVARDDGPWEDAFTEFEDRMCWGMFGGDLYLESQITANRTILAQRLSVLNGNDHREQEDKMWQATMVGHHHDPWLVPAMCFGNWDYDTYHDVIVACRKEVEQRAGTCITHPDDEQFRVTNPTQRARREWMAVALDLPEGSVSGAAVISKADGEPIPSRLRVTLPHGDGSAARVEGFMLSEVNGFGRADYSVGEGEESTALPARITRDEGSWEIANDSLRAICTTDGIRLFRDDVEVVSDLHLHAKIEGWDEHSTLNDITGELEPSGVACISAEGAMGCLPFCMEIRIAPWSDHFNVHVSCDYEGELTEGTNYWEQDGNLKLVARYPEPVSTLLHHPFELRAPGEKTHSAVHFVLADRKDGNGCALILDRPTGIVADDDATGITLCHSGWALWGRPREKQVKGVDGQRFGDGRVYGAKQYDMRIRPYTSEDRAAAVCSYQDQAYPLQVSARETGPLPVPDIEVDGHSIVSNLSREEQGIILRVWNPLDKETLSIKAPGLRLALVDLEGNALEELGVDAAPLEIDTMQIRSVLLT